MLLRLKQLTSTLCLLFLLTTAQAETSTEQQRTAYLDSLADFLPKLAENATQWWPGMKIDTTPLIIAFDSNATDTEQKDNSLHAFYFTPSDAAWKKLLIHNMPVYFLPNDDLGAHAFHPSVQSPFFRVTGKPAIKFTPRFYLSDPTFSANHGLLASTYYIYHELTSSPHAQEKLAILDHADINNDGFNNAESISLLLLQTVALKHYLATHNQENLKDYVALYQYRNQIIASNNKLFDAAYPALPCALYIYIKAIAANEQDIRQKLLSEQPQFVADHFNPKTNYDNTLDYLDALTFNQTTVSFALDLIVPDWKTVVESTSSTPSDVLQQYYNFSDNAALERVKKAKINLGYANIFNTINEKLTIHLTKVAALQNEYQQNPGIECIVYLPKRDAIRTSFAVDGGEYHADAHTTIMHKATVMMNSAKSAHFRAENTALALQEQQFNNHFELLSTLHTIKMKLSPDTKLIIDGTTDTVGHFIGKYQEIYFHKITITGSATGQSFTLDVPGANGRVNSNASKLNFILPEINASIRTLLMKVSAP